MRFIATTACTLLSSTLLFSHSSFEPDDRVNYSSNYQVEAGVDLFVSGDYLYWTAREDGLNYAHTGKGSGTATIPAIQNGNFDGHLKKVTPGWESAYRVGLGLNFPRSGFDLVGIWTHFDSHAKHSVHSAEGTLFPVWAHPDAAATANATSAQGKWNLELSTIDIECGKSSWFGGDFSLRPFFGIRWLWIDQTLRNHYTYATSPAVTGRLRSASDFEGGGIRAGADLRYAFGAGFSLGAVASGALLYGETGTHFRLKEGETLIASAKDHPLEGMTTLQTSLTLGWDGHFCSDRCHLELHIGWEQNIYFDANRMNHYLSFIGQGNYFQEKGNLYLQGLIAGGRFDF